MSDQMNLRSDYNNQNNNIPYENYDDLFDTIIDNDEEIHISITTEYIDLFIKLMRAKYNTFDNENENKIRDAFELKELSYNSSPQITADEKFINFYTVDSTIFDNILKNSWFDSNAMLALQYVLNKLITNSTTVAIPALVKYYINHLQKIGVVSAYGSLYTANFEQRNNLFVIKTPQKDDSLTHELFVGLYGMNNLRELVPNYVWTFGGFKCTKAIDNGKSVISYCRGSGEQYDYIVLENVRSEGSLSPTSVDQLLIDQNFSADDFIALYLQILYALHTTNTEISFTHYDLHTGNVLIKEFSNTQSILYKTEN